MGFDDDCFDDSDEDIIRQALSSGHPTLEGITLERLKRDGWARLNLPETFAPFAEGGYRTPSGKCEFYSEQLERYGLDPLPVYIPPREIQENAPDLAAKYPLQLISPPANSFLNSTFSQLSSFLKSERQPFIILHPADALAREVSDGETVRVWNDRGECLLVAKVSTRARPGVAVALSIWWNKLSPGRGNVNLTVSQELTDMGAGATFYDNLVEVAKCQYNAGVGRETL